MTGILRRLRRGRLSGIKSSPLKNGETAADRSRSGTISYRGPRNSLERLSEATHLGIKDLNGCAQMSAFSGTVHVPRKVLHL